METNVEWFNIVTSNKRPEVNRRIFVVYGTQSMSGIRYFISTGQMYQSGRFSGAMDWTQAYYWAVIPDHLFLQLPLSEQELPNLPKELL